MNQKNGLAGMLLVLMGLLGGMPCPVLAYEQDIKSLARDMTAKLDGKARKIAVVDLTDLQGNVTELGRFLSEELSIALEEAAPGLEIIDRLHLASLLKEHKFHASGLVDPQTARRLGQIAGVQALVTGSLTPFGDSVRVTIKMLDTETAMMIGSSRGNVTKNAAIDELLSRGIGGAPAAPSMAGSSSGTATAKAQKAVAVTHVTEAEKFVFELQRCNLHGQTITCTLAVLNTGPDRELTLTKDSRLFDDLGNEYTPTKGELANSSFYYSRLSKVLLYDVPVVAHLVFEGVAPQTTSVTSLQIRGSIGDEEFQVAFRGVSLEAKKIAPIGQITQGNGVSEGGAAKSSLLQQGTDAVKEEVGDAVRQQLRKWKDKIIKPEDGGN